MDRPLVDIAGVGPATARVLTDAGFATVALVADAELDALMKVAGIGPARSSSLQADARRLLADPNAKKVGHDVTAAADAKKRTPKKGRKRQRQAKDLQQRAKELQRRARALAKKAKSTKSKKKRKRRLLQAADLEAAAKKAKKQAKQLIGG